MPDDGDTMPYLTNRRIVCVGIVAAWFRAGYTPSARADDSSLPAETMPSLDVVEAKIPELEAWLNNSGLGNAIEIVRPHRGPHPTRDQIVLTHLETRWTRPIDSRDHALADFAALASRFVRTSGHSVQHKLLFKFSQLCGVPLTLAAAHINVVDIDIVAYIAEGGQPATDVNNLRMARTNVIIPAEPPSSTMPGNRLPNGDAVMAVLERRFVARKGQFVRDPTFPGIVPFHVNNLRGEIVSNSRLWERLEGTLFMNLDGDRVLLFLEIGGQYAAAGLGDRPPSLDAFRDLEPRYAKQLANYSSELLQELQMKLGELTR